MTNKTLHDLLIEHNYEIHEMETGNSVDQWDLDEIEKELTGPLIAINERIKDGYRTAHGDISSKMEKANARLKKADKAIQAAQKLVHVSTKNGAALKSMEHWFALKDVFDFASRDYEDDQEAPKPTGVHVTYWGGTVEEAVEYVKDEGSPFRRMAVERFAEKSDPNLGLAPRLPNGEVMDTPERRPRRDFQGVLSDRIDNMTKHMDEMRREIDDGRARIKGLEEKVSNHGHEIGKFRDNAINRDKLLAHVDRIKRNSNKMAMSVFPRLAALEKAAQPPEVAQATEQVQPTPTVDAGWLMSSMRLFANPTWEKFDMSDFFTLADALTKALGDPAWYNHPDKAPEVNGYWIMSVARHFAPGLLQKIGYQDRPMLEKAVNAAMVAGERDKQEKEGKKT